MKERLQQGSISLQVGGPVPFFGPGWGHRPPKKIMADFRKSGTTFGLKPEKAQGWRFGYSWHFLVLWAKKVSFIWERKIKRAES